MTDDRYNYLSHFFGPKGENEDLLNKLIGMIVADYTHWRRNYFSDDPHVTTPQLQRKLEDSSDSLIKETQLMLAGLRRSFPFYSPRYIAHQQSETTIASIVATLAGTLYNSNNVTTESGIVTVDWEIEACNALLKMIGFSTPPEIPTSKSGFQEYRDQLRTPFGWCHLTSGGTVANIEALWVARTVTYFPLALQHACKKADIKVETILPGAPSKRVEFLDARGAKRREVRLARTDLRKIPQRRLLGLKPNESIFLLGKFLREFARNYQGQPNPRQLSEEAWKLIDDSPYSPAKGIGHALKAFPPTIFVSGAAHYSIRKAADILGLGKEAVQEVPMDESFRMDMGELERMMEAALKAKRHITAVVAIAGTTEEGAVDPIHKIVDLRTRFEKSHKHSFWIHVDGAWGGYCRSVFIDSQRSIEGRVTLLLLKKKLRALRKTFAGEPFNFVVGVNAEKSPKRWVVEIIKRLQTFAQQHRIPAKELRSYGAETVDKWFLDAEATGTYKNILSRLTRATAPIFRSKKLNIGLKSQVLFSVSSRDHVFETRDFVSDTVELIQKDGSKLKRPIMWPEESVGEAFMAMGKADSVTIDPHKMGYTVYPNGAVAFQTDRVRHFIKQEAPYITSMGEESDYRIGSVIHNPIRHAAEPLTDLAEVKTSTEAFARYTLEGSRPSASACSLWLSQKTMPFDRDHHGAIIRSSLLAARVLYEWIVNWDDVRVGMGEVDASYKLVSFTSSAPDTNIVIFGAKKITSSKLSSFNELNEQIYSEFSIQGELGRREYSYSQPFFLSKTKFSAQNYPFSTLEAFFERASFMSANDARRRDTLRAEYETHGLVVLRATVMNPYILPTRDIGEHDLFKDFLREVNSAIYRYVARP
jgi:glutamate/tyrosine decarboxylase-like PLP-dependent enzyme